MTTHVRALTASICLLALACQPEPDADPTERVQGADAPIVGGFVETARRYPVAMRFEHPSAPGQYFLRCSASLIGKRTLLTAAHCVVSDDLPPPSEVMFGHDVNQPETLVPIASFVVHPDYVLSEQQIVADIAVVELAADAPEQPVGLLRETMPSGPTSAFVGPDLTFVGFGDTFGGAGDYGTRRVVTYPMWGVGPLDIEGFPIPASTWLWVHENMAEATCNGDSGGPAYFQEDGVERQMGVHSTSNCESIGTDTRADQWMIASFIQEHIDDFEAGDPCRSDGSCNGGCQTGSELVDPDCAPDHCGIDGVCSRSCVMPLDVDCGWNQTFCQDADGACNTECAVLDAECEPFCGTDGVCVKACAVPDVDCEGAGGSGGAQAGAGGGAVGNGGGWTASFEDDGDDPPATGCACRAATRSEGRLGWLLAALGLLVTCGRRTRRRS